MKTILVPTDFSSAAINASNYAAQLAKEFKTNLLLFHVYHVPVAVSTGAPVAIIPNQELKAINEKHLESEANRLIAKYGITVEFMVTMGSPVHEILEREKYTELIVMGMKGAGFISESLIGSSTTAVMKKANIPVLVIPEEVIYNRPEIIVLACDFSESSKLHTLDGLERFITIFNLKLYVINIKQTKHIPALENAMEEYLKKQMQDNEPIYYFSEKDDVVEGINVFLKNKNADMVAVIPHKYSFLEGLFHQSFSKKMTFHTQLPLLSLPDVK